MPNLSLGSIVFELAIVDRGNFNTAMKDADNKIIALTGSSEKAAQAMRKLSESQQQSVLVMRQVNAQVASVGFSMEKLGAQMQKLGKDLTLPWSLLAGAMSGAILKVSTEFDKRMTEVRRTTQMTRMEISSLGDAFIELSTKMPMQDAALKLADIAGMAGQVGIKGRENILNFSQAIAKLTTVFDGLSPTDTAQKMVQIANAFGVDPTRNVERYGAVIAKMATESVATAEQIIAFDQAVAGSARNLGISFANATALGSAVVDLGVSASVAGTALTNLFTKMAERPQAFARSMGISTGEFKRRVKEDAVGAVIEWMRSIEKMNPFEATQAIELLGLRGAKAMNVLQKLSREGVDLFEKHMAQANREMATGSALNEQYGVVSESMAARLNKAMNEFKALGIEMGKNLFPLMRNMLSVFEGIAKALSNDFVMAGAVVTAVLGPVMMLAGGFVRRISDVWMAFSNTIAAYKNVAKEKAAADLAVKASTEALNQEELKAYGLYQAKVAATNAMTEAEARLAKSRLMAIQLSVEEAQAARASVEAARAEVAAKSAGLSSATGGYMSALESAGAAEQAIALARARTAVAEATAIEAEATKNLSLAEAEYNMLAAEGNALNVPNERLAAAAAAKEQARAELESAQAKQRNTAETLRATMAKAEETLGSRSLAASTMREAESALANARAKLVEEEEVLKSAMAKITSNTGIVSSEEEKIATELKVIAIQKAEIESELEAAAASRAKAAADKQAAIEAQAKGFSIWKSMGAATIATIGLTAAMAALTAIMTIFEKQENTSVQGADEFVRKQREANDVQIRQKEVILEAARNAEAAGDNNKRLQEIADKIRREVPEFVSANESWKDSIRKLKDATKETADELDKLYAKRDKYKMDDLAQAIIRAKEASDQQYGSMREAISGAALGGMLKYGDQNLLSRYDIAGIIPGAEKKGYAWTITKDYFDSVIKDASKYEDAMKRAAQLSQRLDERGATQLAAQVASIRDALAIQLEAYKKVEEARQRQQNFRLYGMDMTDEEMTNFGWESRAGRVKVAPRTDNETLFKQRAIDEQIALNELKLADDAMKKDLDAYATEHRLTAEQRNKIWNDLIRFRNGESVEISNGLERAAYNAWATHSRALEARKALHEMAVKMGLQQAEMGTWFDPKKNAGGDAQALKDVRSSLVSLLNQKPDLSGDPETIYGKDPLKLQKDQLAWTETILKLEVDRFNLLKDEARTRGELDEFMSGEGMKRIADINQSRSEFIEALKGVYPQWSELLAKLSDIDDGASAMQDLYQALKSANTETSRGELKNILDSMHTFMSTRPGGRQTKSEFAQFVDDINDLGLSMKSVYDNMVNATKRFASKIVDIFMGGKAQIGEILQDLSRMFLEMLAQEGIKRLVLLLLSGGNSIAADATATSLMQDTSNFVSSMIPKIGAMDWSVPSVPAPERPIINVMLKGTMSGQEFIEDELPTYNRNKELRKFS